MIFYDFYVAHAHFRIHFFYFTSYSIERYHLSLPGYHLEDDYYDDELPACHSGIHMHRTALAYHNRNVYLFDFHGP